MTGRQALVAALALALAFQLAVAPADEAAAGLVSLDIAGATSAIAVLGDPVETRSAKLPLQLTMEERHRLDHLWVWANDCPVSRVGQDEVDTFRCPAAAARLTVQLSWPGSQHTEVPAGRLYGAPVAMWREVFEPLLPSWAADANGIVGVPVAADTPLRIRFEGDHLGSAWREVTAGARHLDLELSDSVDRRTRLLGPDGEIRQPAFLSVSVPGRSRDEPRALYTSDETGDIPLQALPPDTKLVMVANARGLLPARLETTADHLPKAIRLDAGCWLAGRAEDPQGVPVSGVRVQAEGYSGSGRGLLFQTETTTDDSGHFRLGPLALAPVALSLRAEGRAPKVLRRYLADCVDEVELGPIVLAAAATLRIHVVDDLGVPVDGAEVRTSRGESKVSDEGGMAVVEVATDDAVGLEISAERHLTRQQTLVPPLPESVTIELQRAAVVHGRLVSAEGLRSPASCG